MSPQPDFSTHVGVQVVVELMVVATAVAVLTKKIKVPYTVALVIVGVLIGFSHLLHPIGLSYDVILLIFLPPLLFEGTISMDLEILREKWREVFLFAFPVTLLSVCAVGAAAHYLLGYSWTIALLFGAIISPTDPISVLSLFRELGVSKRLSTIVEGESCFNDGLGVVLFVILSKLVKQESMTAVQVSWVFFSEVAGGLAVGIVLGYAAYLILKRIDDHLIEVMLSVALAFGSYILADRLHFSGVMGVVASGLIVGNYGRVLSMSPGTRLVLSSFWEVMGFIANSLLFLLMGIAMESIKLGHYAGKIAAVFIVILAARMLLVYTGSFLLRIIGHGLPASWQHTIGWAGLRGSIPIALALGVALPAAALGVPEREEFLTIIFGVVALSIVLQGLTIRPLLVRLGLIRKDRHEIEFERFIGSRMALHAAAARLEKMNAEGQVPFDIYQALKNSLVKKEHTLAESMSQHMDLHPDLANTRKDDVLRALALAERASLEDAFSSGFISEEVFSELRKEVDLRIEGDTEDGKDTERVNAVTSI
ncbi:MAG: Na+/H+ antiporter [Candidatus Xenobiia bacterium LiM19]